MTVEDEMPFEDEMAESGIDGQSVEDGRQLLRAFIQVQDAAKRQEVIALVKSLVAAEPERE
ncbi:hypothetical protein [Phyllobacterium leguminum]|nr:hypothetical protein [Phyllobacterium leguminum]